MNPRLIHVSTLALALAAACALILAPRSAHGEPQPGDAHEVPPFAKGRTDIVQGEAAPK